MKNPPWPLWKRVVVAVAIIVVVIIVMSLVKTGNHADRQAEQQLGGFVRMYARLLV